MINKNALILVDLQRDFCEGGALAVQGGNEVVEVANTLQKHFNLVIATKDWHPQDHTSFASNHPNHKMGETVIVEGLPQILWPDHCVQHSSGAEFNPRLNTKYIAQVFHKGVEKNIDSYSAFFDNAHRRATGLGDYLQQHHVNCVYIMGLATDYCVKFSTLDALHLGFEVYVIEEGCRGVNIKPDDSLQALKEVAQAGAKIIHPNDILEQKKLS